MATEFTYANSEFEFITGEWLRADVTLTLLHDSNYGAGEYVGLYMAESEGRPVSGWLRDALLAWTDQNQARLVQAFIDLPADIAA